MQDSLATFAFLRVPADSRQHRRVELTQESIEIVMEAGVLQQIIERCEVWRQVTPDSVVCLTAERLDNFQHGGSGHEPSTSL